MYSMEGKLLVAHPMVTHGLFARSVVYVYQDDPVNGTMGLILNKPTTYKFTSLLAERGLDYVGSERVYKGGPVNEQAIVLLHTDDWYSSNTVQTSEGLALTSDVYMLEKISQHNNPQLWRCFAGVSAWSPGQLDRELSRDLGWLVCDAQIDTVFHKDGERQWNAALKLCVDETVRQYI